MELDVGVTVTLTDEKVVEIIVNDLKESYMTLLHFQTNEIEELEYEVEEVEYENDNKVLIALSTVLDYYLTHEQHEKWLKEVEEFKKSKEMEPEEKDESDGEE